MGFATKAEAKKEAFQSQGIPTDTLVPASQTPSTAAFAPPSKKASPIQSAWERASEDPAAFSNMPSTGRVAVEPATTTPQALRPDSSVSPSLIASLETHEPPQA